MHLRTCPGGTGASRRLLQKGRAGRHCLPALHQPRQLMLVGTSVNTIHDPRILLTLHDPPPRSPVHLPIQPAPRGGGCLFKVAPAPTHLASSLGRDQWNSEMTPALGRGKDNQPHTRTSVPLAAGAEAHSWRCRVPCWPGGCSSSTCVGSRRGV